MIEEIGEYKRTQFCKGIMYAFRDRNRTAEDDAFIRNLMKEHIVRAFSDSGVEYSYQFSESTFIRDASQSIVLSNEIKTTFGNNTFRSVSKCTEYLSSIIKTFEAKIRELGAFLPITNRDLDSTSTLEQKYQEYISTALTTIESTKKEGYNFPLDSKYRTGIEKCVAKEVKRSDSNPDENLTIKGVNEQLHVATSQLQYIVRIFMIIFIFRFI